MFLLNQGGGILYNVLLVLEGVFVVQFDLHGHVVYNSQARLIIINMNYITWESIMSGIQVHKFQGGGGGGGGCCL